MELAIEIDADRNDCLFFAPLQRRLRGRLDLSRDSQPQAKVLAATRPLPIPGLIIGWDGTKGYVEDPLYEAEHAAVRELIEKEGFTLGPQRDEFESEEPTWIFHLMRAVQAGLGRIVRGKMPAKLPSGARTDFINPVTTPKQDRILEALERQTMIFEKLLAKLE